MNIKRPCFPSWKGPSSMNAPKPRDEQPGPKLKQTLQGEKLKALWKQLLALLTTIKPQC